LRLFNYRFTANETAGTFFYKPQIERNQGEWNQHSAIFECTLPVNHDNRMLRSIDRDQ